MDYEKKYKEALEMAKDFYKGYKQRDNQLYANDLETIFPELCESEDEKIRKEIIKFLELPHRQFVGERCQEEWIAWLEKQDKFIENNEDDSDTDFTIYHPLKNSKGHYECIPYSFYGTLSSFSEDKDMIDFLHLCFYTEEECNKWIKQNESTDTLEHKFNVDDWVTTDKGDTIQITAANSGYYTIDNGMEFSTSYVDKYWHLWTIQDAKDGDVLVFKNNIGGIIICKSPSDYDTRSYCRLIRDNLINKEESGWDSTLLVPATKEQRDTLLKAMADAGYTFDFDKKELKKIEKKSQRMVSAEAKEALYDKPTDEEMKELLRTEYEKGRADVITKMKSSWSEEDEKRLKSCLNILQPKTLLGNVETINTNWLKSLKDRYTWRPSNEQIEALEHFVRSIGESGYASPYDNNTKLLYSLLEQLKKLKA